MDKDNQDALSAGRVNLIELCEADPRLANDLVAHASKYPALLRSAITGVPWPVYTGRPLAASQVGRLVATRGSVIRTHPVLFKNVSSEYLCLACNQTSFASEGAAGGPRLAPRCVACGSASLRVNRDFHRAVSSQSVRIQDLSSAGAMSETAEVVLEEGLAGTCMPGDKIYVTGVVCRRWRHLRANEPMLSSLFLRAVSVVKEDAEQFGALELQPLLDELLRKPVFRRRRFLMDSFAPEISGLRHVKLGLLLALIGGGSSPGRSSIHVLLAGDPATGKSHLLRAASRLVSPVVVASGVGTTDAGLTSCAVRQGKEWSLEAGALVLADTGLCCIDQFQRLRVGDKSGLLEAMEQQTISVAKAGIVATLNTRCTVLAAATRHGYSPSRTVTENLRLSTPLVSRFDLIFGFTDHRDKQQDQSIAEAVLLRGSSRKAHSPDRWPPEILRAYIARNRRSACSISGAGSQTLLRYYARKRKRDGFSEFNTVRMLESLVRLAEADAKLLGTDAVEPESVYVAIILMETTVSPGNAPIDTWRVFSDEEYFSKTSAGLARAYELEERAE